MLTKKLLKKITDVCWEIPKTFRQGMSVPARIFASEKMLEDILKDRSLEQLINVATLPGIQKWALAMPDIHEGYGFPIGGVAAMRYPDGIISPGGIGYDINCGVRLLLSEISLKHFNQVKENLGEAIFRSVPAGLGRGGQTRLSTNELDEILQTGVNWALKRGYGQKDDVRNIESNGSLAEADPSKVSDQAKRRGHDQVGTMGAGNHFVEVGYVAEIFDETLAKQFNLFKNQITVLIHTGSRGLGHQVATDYLQVMMKAMPKYGIKVPDRELAGVPFSSSEGQDYFAAMSSAANFAWANRQVINHLVRENWQKVFPDNSKLKLLYDVAHNIAKIEEYDNKKVIIHRKGATRAFEGQPVIIPGSMGTASYVLIGTKENQELSFGSTCHGAGRTMSRHEAIRKLAGKNLFDELKKQGVIAKTWSRHGLAEEAPLAYKDIDNVVEVVSRAKLAQKIAKLKPLIVVKG